MRETTVVVHGTVYDKATGRPIRAERARHNAHAHTATAIHAPTQKSRTLHRKYVQPKKAAEAVESKAAIVGHTHRTPAAHPTHPDVQRIAKQPVHKPQVAQPVIRDIAPTPHHLVQRVAQQTQKPAPHAVKPSHVLKREAIDKATAAMPSKTSKHAHAEPKAPRSRTGRALSIASTAVALLLIGGYVTYLNMPALSTRVAAAQAGINATYPAYQPSGYSLSGPVAFQQGNVSMTFAANAGPQNFTISQTKSGWDSSAVLENYVTPHAGSDYVTNSVNGLTVYTYGNNAAWVNGGILYTIDGTAPLSVDQVERIATSM